MAKSKAKVASKKDPGSSSKGPTANLPPKPSLPTFDDTALSNLTEKLEKQLGTPGDEKLSKTKGNKKNQEDKTLPKRESAHKASDKDEAAIKKGKKRARNGDVRTSQAEPRPSNPKDANGDLGNKDFEEEVYALGGTKEDLELIASLESGSELDGDVRQSRSKGSVDEKSLKKGINELVKDVKRPGDLSNASIDSDETESLPDIAMHTSSKPDKSAAPTLAHDNKVAKERSAQKTKRNLTLEPRPDWYAAELPKLPELPTKASSLPKPLLDRLHTRAKTLLEAENQAYAATTEKGSSSHKFYNTIMTSGTLTDKVSALTLSAQESPLHNMKALENLLGLARKRSRAQAVEVLRALKDLFAQGSLLPSDRRLKHFQNQPGLVAAFRDSSQDWTPGNGLPKNLQNQHLILWAFEHWLKDVFFEILKILEIWCNDEIEFARSRAVSYVFELLKEKPEQESNLLRLLVNKLGDPTKKIASRASYLLLQLESVHPLMKATIISAIESEFLFKPGQSQHAKYYGVITLNQTALSVKEGDVAKKLLEIYFSLFVTILKPEDKKKMQSGHQRPGKPSGKGKRGSEEKKPDTHSADNENALREKMVSAILTGVNRTYPYSSADSESLSKHADALFKITHSSNFNTSIQALMLIQQLSATHQMSTDRFYRTLYESLLDPRLINSSKQSLYLNLLYRSLKQDLNVKRIKAFIKRIVQVLNLHQPTFVCGAFHLIRELEQTFPSVKGLIDEAQDIESDDEENFQDVPEGIEGEEKEQVPTDSRNPRRLPRYDSRKRDPEHSNADRSCLWELSPFLTHFHPSVALSSQHLLGHKALEGKPDLSLHTLIHFLDRFVYRNPKAGTSALRGTSVMQPLAGSDRGDLLVSARPTTRLQTPVNDESFWKKQAGDVAAEDAFFHEYFSRIGKEKKPSRKDNEEARKEHGSESDEEGEEEIWKALVRSKGDVEPDEDSDVDLDMDDMESDEEGEGEEGKSGELDEADEADDIDDDEDVLDGEDLGLDDSDDPWADSDWDLLSDADVAGGEVVEAEEGTTGSNKDERKKKRRKLKQLPTFASAEDYAAMLDDDDGEDLG